MGGLLDKAKKSEYSDSVHQGDNVSNKVINDPDAIITAYEKGKSSGDGLLSKTESETKEETAPWLDSAKKSKKKTKSNSPDDSKSKIFIGSGVFLLVVSMGLMLILDIISGFIALGCLIISYGLFSFGWKEFKGEWQTGNLLVFGVVWLILAGIPYAATFDWTAEGRITIVSISFEEDTDTLLFGVRSTCSDETDISIIQNGVIMWERVDKNVGSDETSFSVDLVDFYVDSPLNNEGDALLSKVYSIKANSGGDCADEYDINNKLLDRDIKNAGGELGEITEYNSEDDTNEGKGVTIKAYVGVATGEQRDVNGNEYNKSIRPVTSDYTLQLEIIAPSGSTSWTSQLITVDGDNVGWSDSSTSEKFFQQNWFEYDESNFQTSDLEQKYLERGEFYDGDGCYRMKFTITPEGRNPVTDDSAGFHYYWEYNENRGQGEDYKAMHTC